MPKHKAQYAEQEPAQNVREPVHARDEAPDRHERRKQDGKNGRGRPDGAAVPAGRPGGASPCGGRERGLELWLHNNAQEIADKLNGISAYEYILRACGGKLGAQVDTGWVACGGEDVAAFLERNADYVRSIHHKDVVALSDKPDNVALGQGVVDPRIAFDFAVRNGLGQIVDQDNTLGSLTDDLRVSADFLRTL